MGNRSTVRPGALLVRVRQPLLRVDGLTVRFGQRIGSNIGLDERGSILPVLNVVRSRLRGNGLLVGIVANRLGVRGRSVLSFSLCLTSTAPTYAFNMRSRFVSSNELSSLSVY